MKPSPLVESRTEASNPGGPWGLPLAAIFTWGAALRLWDLGQPFLGDHSWNEVVYSQPHAIKYSPPLVPWLVRQSQSLFGPFEWAARLPIFVFGLASLVLFALLVRAIFGRRLALAATLLAATSPGIVLFSRNVQLDGVMTAFGLAALLTALRTRKRGGPLWHSLTWALFSLAFFSKYTAILFWPALAWILAGPVGDERRRTGWPGLCLATLAAVLPGVGWLFSAIAADQWTPTETGPAAYLWRWQEFGTDFVQLAKSLWTTLPRQIGPVAWYPGVALGLLLLPRLWTRSLLMRHAVPILMIAPWFLQMVYPISWMGNEYYIYPALYGFCIELAAVGLAAQERLLAGLGSQSRRFILAALVVFVAGSNAWDYRNTYHQSYHPWPLIQQAAPFYSARRVAEENEDGKPVLADLPQTLYYAGAGENVGTFHWWAESAQPMIDAVASRRFEFVVFTYPPPIDVVEAIRANDYVRIAPAAWRRGYPTPGP